MPPALDAGIPDPSRGAGVWVGPGVWAGPKGLRRGSRHVRLDTQ